MASPFENPQCAELPLVKSYWRLLALRKKLILIFRMEGQTPNDHACEGEGVTRILIDGKPHEEIERIYCDALDLDNSLFLRHSK